RPRVDTAQLIDRCINGPDEHWLIPVSCKPVGKFQPKVQFLFHNHDAHPLTGLPVRHHPSSLHSGLSVMPPHGARAAPSHITIMRTLRFHYWFVKSSLQRPLFHERSSSHTTSSVLPTHLHASLSARIESADPTEQRLALPVFRRLGSRWGRP